jgi:hypothetical protein
MDWRRWRWLEDGVLPLLAAAVRLCWLWPWLEMLRRWLTPAYQPPWLPMWSIPVLFLGATFVTRVALSRAAGLRQARGWVAGAGLAAVLGLLWWQFARDAYALTDAAWLRQVGLMLTNWRNELPPSVLTLLVAAGIWLRGVLDGRQRRLRDDIWRTCATGYIALALLTVAGQLDPAGPPPQTGGWMVALVAASLSALALSSLELAASAGGWRTPKHPQPPLSRYWLTSVVLVIAGMLAIGLALGALFTPGMVAHALGWTTVVLRWLGTLVGYVLLAVAYVLFLFLTPLIEWIRARLAGSQPREALPMQDFRQEYEELARRPAPELSPLAAETLRWLGLAGVVIVLLVIFALALRYFRGGEEDEVDETRELILSRALLQAQLSSLWRRWLDRLRRPLRVHVSPYLGLEGEEENRRAVRAVYQALLNLAKSLGYPRSPAQTPAEYQALLTATWPQEAGAWRSMTAGYVAARYGLHPPSTQEVEQVRQAWSDAHAALSAQASGQETAEAQPRDSHRREHKAR